MPCLLSKRAWGRTLVREVLQKLGGGQLEVRNNVVFRGRQANLGMASDSVKFRVVWWFKNHGCRSKEDLTLLLLNINEICVDNASGRPVNNSVWSHPSDNILFFNVDGSSRGNPWEAGIGGSLRDDSGKILCLFSFYLGVIDSSSGEVHTILQACQLIVSNKSLPEHSITIITDSKLAESWIKGEDFENLKLVKLVYDIRQYLQGFQDVDIKFMPRSLNALADSLANSGSGNQGDRLVWGVF
ncbi:hypothetical protein Dsin_024454 [Dipteronia sinensis]|uniref:RNase H type-1 domain-containing protein n=1 Tax=Dipteronia sinensis TaxID=43782 RepID=A0AAE0DXE8_9ROSI|nr:hypothetical protein Dsin_024454 [Dipteronia sinensis]